MNRGIDTYQFLCDEHASARSKAGWSLKKIGETENRCGDCVMAEQAGSVVLDQ